MLGLWPQQSIHAKQKVFSTETTRNCLTESLYDVGNAA